MGQWDSDTGQKSWALTLNRQTTSDTWKFLISTNGTTTIQKLSSFNSVGTNWAHMAVTYDGTTVRMYENGAYRGGEVSSDNLFNSTAPFTIGNQTTYSAEVGSEISEVRVTKGVARYTEAFTPTTEPFPRS